MTFFKIYFSCRDKNNKGYIGFIIININKPNEIIGLSDTPVLAPGSERGIFDDSGVSLASIHRAGDKRYLYYLGWNLAVTVPFRNTIGLAVSDTSTAEFTRVSRAPIVDRSDIDPFCLSYPWVLQDEQAWKMWYGSNLDWGNEDREMTHTIKYAESADGIHWQRKGIVALPLNLPEEYAISKPCIIKENDLYKMWYSYRGAAYRIGYAESLDGIEWVRMDEKVGIDVSVSGWDSDMIEYASVFDFKGTRYMLYNGNGYGKTGLGLAQLAS